MCVCTHSPYFFSATDAGTYVRFCKTPSQDGAAPPCSDARHVTLGPDVSAKDSFQIVCYENNNAAFFCFKVLLVEGDCDVIYLTHVARILNPAWNFERQNLAIVKVGGKGSFERYRRFFEAFGVEVRIVADLDAIVDDFNKLGASEAASVLRAQLIQEVDKIRQSATPPDLSGRQLAKTTGARTFKERYLRCKEIAAKACRGEKLDEQELLEFGQLFAGEDNYARREILATDASLQQRKEELLAALRADGIVVLARGAIEAYYPDGVKGGDKPSQALDACRKAASADEIRQRCANGDGEPELDLAFECIFGGTAIS